MADGSNVTLNLEFDKLPLIKNVIEYAELGCLTGGANANREFLEGKVSISVKLSKAQTDVLYDAQTSGGLLMAFAPADAAEFKAAAAAAGLSIPEIGKVVERREFSILIS
jgi:selenide,water dikinase